MRRNIECNFGTDSEEHYVGRKPTRDELDKWVQLLRKGVDSQLDQDIINRCAAAEFK
jgi:hypothetical protein